MLLTHVRWDGSTFVDRHRVEQALAGEGGLRGEWWFGLVIFGLWCSCVEIWETVACCQCQEFFSGFSRRTWIRQLER